MWFFADTVITLWSPPLRIEKNDAKRACGDWRAK
jgi:hypothetical protein